MSSIDRQTTSDTGLVYEMAAVQTSTPGLGVAGGAIGYVSVPSSWDGGLSWTWHMVITVDGAVVNRPITDAAGAPVASSVIVGSVNEIPPAAMGARTLLAKFSSTTLAQTLRVFTKG